MLAMTTAQQRSWEQDGYIVMRAFFTAPELQRLLRAVDAVGHAVRAAASSSDELQRQPEQEGSPSPGSFSVRNLVGHSEAFLELVDHPRMLPLVVDAMGPNIQLRTSHLDFRPPYTSAVQQQLQQRLHRDPSANAVNGANNVGWHPDLKGLFMQTEPGDGVLPFMEVKAFYTLSDMSTANCGNLWLAAGSHRRPVAELQAWKQSGLDGGLPTEPPPGAVELRLPAGAAVLWRTACWHCVGPQLGSTTRKIIHIGYNHRWLRPTDYMEQEPSLLARCSPIRQQLLGGVPSGAVMGGDAVFEPTSAYYRQHEADVPLVAWAAAQQRQRQRHNSDAKL